MHPTPIERIKLALRALPSHDTNARALTPSELERLKSWFEGDSTGMSAAQVAQKVIQQEMAKQKKARLRSASAGHTVPRREDASGGPVPGDLAALGP